MEAGPSGANDPFTDDEEEDDDEVEQLAQEGLNESSASGEARQASLFGEGGSEEDEEEDDSGDDVSLPEDWEEQLAAWDRAAETQVRNGDPPPRERSGPVWTRRGLLRQAHRVDSPAEWAPNNFWAIGIDVLDMPLSMYEIDGTPNFELGPPGPDNRDYRNIAYRPTRGKKVAPWFRGAQEKDPVNQYSHVAYGFALRKYCDAWKYLSSAVEALLECDSRTYGQPFNAAVLQYRIAKFNDALECQIYSLVWHVVDPIRADSTGQKKDAYYWGAGWATNQNNKGDRSSPIGQARRYSAYYGRDAKVPNGGGLFGHNGRFAQKLSTGGAADILGKHIAALMELEEKVRVNVLDLAAFDLNEYSADLPSFDPTPVTPHKASLTDVVVTGDVRRYFAAVEELRAAMNPSGGEAEWGSWYKLLVMHVRGSPALTLEVLIDGGDVEAFRHDRAERTALPVAPSPRPPDVGPVPQAQRREGRLRQRSKTERLAVWPPLDSERPGMSRTDFWLWEPFGTYPEPTDDTSEADRLKFLLWQAVHRNGNDRDGAARQAQINAPFQGQIGAAQVNKVLYDDLTESERAGLLHQAHVALAKAALYWGDRGEGRGETAPDVTAQQISAHAQFVAKHTPIMMRERFRRHLLATFADDILRENIETLLLESAKKAKEAAAQAEEKAGRLLTDVQMGRQSKLERTSNLTLEQGRKRLLQRRSDQEDQDASSGEYNAIRAAADKLRQEAHDRSVTAAVRLPKNVAEKEVFEARLLEIENQFLKERYGNIANDLFTTMLPMLVKLLAEREHIIRKLGFQTTRVDWSSIASAAKGALVAANGSDAKYTELPSLQEELPATEANPEEVRRRCAWSKDEWTAFAMKIWTQSVLTAIGLGQDWTQGAQPEDPVHKEIGGLVAEMGAEDEPLGSVATDLFAAYRENRNVTYPRVGLRQVFASFRNQLRKPQPPERQGAAVRRVRNRSDGGEKRGSSAPKREFPDLRKKLKAGDETRMRNDEAARDAIFAWITTAEAVQSESGRLYYDSRERELRETASILFRLLIGDDSRPGVFKAMRVQDQGLMLTAMQYRYAFLLIDVLASAADVPGFMLNGPASKRDGSQYASVELANKLNRARAPLAIDPAFGMSEARPEFYEATLGGFAVVNRELLEMTVDVGALAAQNEDLYGRLRRAVLDAEWAFYYSEQERARFYPYLTDGDSSRFNPYGTEMSRAGTDEVQREMRSLQVERERGREQQRRVVVPPTSIADAFIGIADRVNLARTTIRGRVTFFLDFLKEAYNRRTYSPSDLVDEIIRFLLVNDTFDYDATEPNLDEDSMHALGFPVFMIFHDLMGDLKEVQKLTLDAEDYEEGDDVPYVHLFDMPVNGAYGNFVREAIKDMFASNRTFWTAYNTPAADRPDGESQDQRVWRLYKNRLDDDPEEVDDMFTEARDVVDPELEPYARASRTFRAARQVWGAQASMAVSLYPREIDEYDAKAAGESSPTGPVVAGLTQADEDRTGGPSQRPRAGLPPPMTEGGTEFDFAPGSVPVDPRVLWEKIQAINKRRTEEEGKPPMQTAEDMAEEGLGDEQADMYRALNPQLSHYDPAWEFLSDVTDFVGDRTPLAGARRLPPALEPRGGARELRRGEFDRYALELTGMQRRINQTLKLAAEAEAERQKQLQANEEQLQASARAAAANAPAIAAARNTQRKRALEQLRNEKLAKAKTRQKKSASKRAAAPAVAPKPKGGRFAKFSNKALDSEDDEDDDEGNRLLRRVDRAGASTQPRSEQPRRGAAARAREERASDVFAAESRPPQEPDDDDDFVNALRRRDGEESEGDEEEDED